MIIIQINLIHSQVTGGTPTSPKMRRRRSSSSQATGDAAAERSAESATGDAAFGQWPSGGLQNRGSLHVIYITNPNFSKSLKISQNICCLFMILPK